MPGRYITLIDRKSDDYNASYQLTGTYTETLNMSSYNYLGFAQSEGPCADAVEECVRRYSLSYCSPRMDAGTSDLALEVEREIAAFVGKPAAMVFSMGFVTNASSFQALVSKGCLILSDELNHASIRIGARLSGALIRSFKHNDMDNLERKLREAISQGQPRTHPPLEEDPGRHRGPVLHGGHHVRPAQHPGAEEEVQVLPVRRRGPQHRRPGPARPRRLRLLPRRPQRGSTSSWAP